MAENKTDLAQWLKHDILSIDEFMNNLCSGKAEELLKDHMKEVRDELMEELIKVV